jgi:hypothetical protein
LTFGVYEKNPPIDPERKKKVQSLHSSTRLWRQMNVAEQRCTGQKKLGLPRMRLRKK